MKKAFLVSAIVMSMAALVYSDNNYTSDSIDLELNPPPPYAVDGPVHQWIVLQAYLLLTEDEACADLTNEMKGYLKENGDDPYYSPGFDDTSWSVNDSLYATRDTALIEGAWEEDKNFMYTRHFWDPDIGYDAGLSGQPSAIQTAQDRWRWAKNAYALNQPTTAYYWLGRTAHLLADMSVPAHVLADPHPISDCYEYFTKTDEHYKLITADGAHGLPVNISAPPYSAPAGDDPWLLYLFYGLAEIADDYDSDNAPGEVSRGAYNHGILGYISNDVLYETYQPKLQGSAIRYTAELFKRFWQDTHAIVHVMTSGNGTVDPEGEVSVRFGTNATFTAVPDSGFTVDTWVAYYHNSGYSSTIQTGGNTCTLSSVNQNITLQVYFKQSGGVQPFGDLIITEPAMSPYETGNNSVSFTFRVPDETHTIVWDNPFTGMNGEIIKNTNGMWKGSVSVNTGTNPITFTARDSNNNTLASTPFTVIKLDNMLSVTVGSDNCDWAYYWKGEPSERYTSSEIVIGWTSSSYSGNYGWEEAVVRFDMPSLQGRMSGTDIEAQFKAYLYESGSYGKGDCKITAAAISPDWTYRLETVNWNRRPMEYMAGTDFEVNVYANPASTTKRWISFDASQAVESWLGGITNKGFVLWASGNPFEGTTTSSSNYNRYFKDYRLEISYQVETNSPTLVITSPQNDHTVSHSTSNTAVSGTASDDTGINSITWKNNTTGSSGTASGTTSWNFNVGLEVGSNQIVVTVTDVVGNITSQMIFVNRAVPDMTPPAKPGNCSTLPLPEAVKVAWQNPQDADFGGVLILRGLEPLTGTLSNGTSYSVGNVVGNAIVVYSGSSDSYDDTELIPYAKYHYAIYSCDELLNYSEGIYLFGVPLPQPDLDGDSKVNLPDFAILASKWLLADCNDQNNWCEHADINHSGNVSLDDFDIMSKRWLEGTSLSEDIIYWADFESDPVDSWPTGWVKDANASAAGNGIVVDPNGTPNQALRLYGSVGSCWGALAYHPCDFPAEFYTECDIYNGSETLSGCHPDRGDLSMRNGSSWSNPSRPFLLFKGNGDILGTDGTVLGTYNTEQWYHVKVHYKRIGSNLTLSYWIDGSAVGQLNVTIDDLPREESLNHVELTAQEGSVFFDNLKIYTVGS